MTFASKPIVRVLTVGRLVVVQDIRAYPERDTQPITSIYERPDGAGPARARVVSKEEQAHLESIAALHNARLEYERGSIEHVRLGQQIADSSRAVVGEMPFLRFPSARVDQKLRRAREGTTQHEVLWAAYSLIDAVDILAHEYVGSAVLMFQSYAERLSEWFELMGKHRSDTLRRILGGHSPIHH